MAYTQRGSKAKERVGHTPMGGRIAVMAALLALIGVVAAAPLAHALVVGPDVGPLVFDTELVSMNLSGGPFPMPLASDPGNALGDSIEGYGFVNSQIQIGLSSQRGENPGPRSLGQAVAQLGGPAPGAAGLIAGGPPAPPINPDQLHGLPFFVNSFFDVFFDITVTDVDARQGRNFAGQPDGAALSLLDNGPASMQSNYSAVFDKTALSFGLIPPPEAAPYIGHFNIEIPLGGDINGNGENDKIKFTLATHAVGDENRTFIILPDGTVIDSFDSAASLDGAIVDESADPPFSISLTGPSTATSRLQNPIQVPEPSALALIGAGMAALALGRRRRKS